VGNGAALGDLHAARAGLSRRADLLPLLAALGIYGFFSVLFSSAGLDDPFITFRYARNLVSGWGPVWNPGEAPVEGYTEFLWMLIVAAALRLGADPLVVTRWAGLAAGAVLLGLPYLAARPLGLDRAGRAIASLLLALSPVLAFYAVSGMGHVFFTLLGTGAALCYAASVGERPHRGAAAASGLLFGLSALARPEGLGLMGLTLGFELARQLLLRRRDGAQLASLALPFAALTLPFFLWRLGYYGWPLPNTFYAKHSGGGLIDAVAGGVRYLADGLSGWTGIVLAATVAALGRRARHERSSLAISPCC
jgi:hypothetical protein